MIIETSANRFYEVTETGFSDLAHCWYGIEVRCDRKRGWVKKARISHPRPELVRKAGCRIVAELSTHAENLKTMIAEAQV